MKYRESGMPDKDVWNTFFDADKILRNMQVNENINTFVDIGCGYGTFLFPAAHIVRRAVGVDIDENVIRLCRNMIAESNIRNVDLISGDVTRADARKLFDKYENTIDYIALFNILHCEKPLELLRFAESAVNPGGRIGVIHWIHDNTPRGPSLSIRPKPEDIIKLASQTRLTVLDKIDLPPYHYGLVFQRSI